MTAPESPQPVDAPDDDKSHVPPLTTRVVIAEDEALIRLDLKEMLEEEGYSVVGEAGDGEQAVLEMTAILRRAIKVNSVILANLVIGDNVIPEYLQEDCTPEKLAAALRDLLGTSDLRRRQLEAFATIDGIMSTGNQPPSSRAAEIVLATMRKSRDA